MNTQQFAALAGVRPGTIRVSLSTKGHYLGIQPVKLPNRLLHWPDDEVARLFRDNRGKSTKK